MPVTTRTDPAGRWESRDGGTSWTLTEPSPAWLASRPEPAPEPSPYARVRTYTLLAVLDLAGLDPEAAVELLPEPDRTLARRGLTAPWIDRDHALTYALAAVMGLTTEQVDGFFREAHDLSVS